MTFLLVNRRQVSYQGINGSRVFRLPRLDLRLSDLCNLDEQVHTPKQDVDMLGLKDELPFLCRDEAVFHRMRDPYGGIKTDNPRGSLQRVCCSHERLDRLGRGQSSLKCHQAR